MCCDLHKIKKTPALSNGHDRIQLPNGWLTAASFMATKRFYGLLKVKYNGYILRMGRLLSKGFLQEWFGSRVVLFL